MITNMQKNQDIEMDYPIKSPYSDYLRSGIGKCMPIFVVLILLVNINPVSALKLPSEYGDEQCELIAKDYQREFGGDLIFVQPLKENGAYDLGEFKGKWLNRAWNKNQGSYYVDWESQTYFQSIEAIKDWYYFYEGQKAEVFNLNQGGVPFGLVYHY